MKYIVWLFLIFHSSCFVEANENIEYLPLVESPPKVYRPKIGPMLSMNFLTMDYVGIAGYNHEVRSIYPEKYRGFSLGVMSEIPFPNHEQMFSILVDASIEYMPTFDIDNHKKIDYTYFQIMNEFNHVLASVNGGIMFRVVDTGLKIGGGVGVNFVYSNKYSYVTLDSSIREEIANKNIKVIEYKPDKKTAEVESKYEYSPNPIRIPIYFILGYEFEGNKFSFFPYFRFNNSIFAQGSYGFVNYSVSAYQAGITIMLPYKK